MVDHQGSHTQNGGHARVAVKTDFQTLGTVSFAQAQRQKAMILDESVDDLVQKNQENIWLIRPNVRM